MENNFRTLVIPLLLSQFLTLLLVPTISSELLIAKPLLFNEGDGQPQQQLQVPQNQFQQQQQQYRQQSQQMQQQQGLQQSQQQGQQVEEQGMFRNALASIPTPSKAVKVIRDPMSIFYNPTTTTTVPPQVLLSKPLFDPYASASTKQKDVVEQGGIEIPELGGIEYYELMHHIRSLTNKAKDVAVQVPGNVAGVMQTAWRGSSNLIQQAAENMPEIQLPNIANFQLPIKFATSDSSEDSYSDAAEPLPAFPFFRLKWKNRPPAESYWLDTYGV